MTPLRLAIRSLRAAPVFTMTALATLAICLGATLTIFALVDAVLLRPLPYPQADRLVTMYHAYPKLSLPADGASLTSYYERRSRIPAFDSIAAIDQAASLIGETGATSRERLGRVTPEFFATLGVAPVLGRAFLEAELTYQTDHVAMLSYEYWQRQYAGDPQVLDRAVRVDGIARRIVGVLPPGFRFLSFEAPVYMPLSSEEAERNVAARHSPHKTLIARLRPGATLAEAQAQVDADDRARAPEFPQAAIVAESGFHSVVAPLHAQHVEAVRTPLLLLQAGALVLLAIGGVNLVNLWLVRATGHTRERAIRQALGAGRRRLAIEVAVETLLVAMAGAGLGLVAADAGVRALQILGADRLPLGARLALDARVIVAAFASAVVVGGAVALPVVLFTRRSSLAATLQAESRSVSGDRGAERLRQGFIVAQIALSFVLLAAASLLGVSPQRAVAVSPGFRAAGAIAAQFTLPWTDTQAVSVEGRAAPPGTPVATPRTNYLVVRSAASAEGLAPSLARLVRTIDPELPLTDIRSMDARVADSLQPRRTPALIAGLFALTAVLLAAIGLYGVMAYAVAARTSEFGVRMALGAVRSDVLRLVLGQGWRLIVYGVALGVAGSVWTSSLLSRLLFEISPTSPVALGLVAVGLAGIATIACAVPAVRAARVSPLVALRK